MNINEHIEQNATSETTRHDVPRSVRGLLAVALDCRVADVIDLYTLAINCGIDWRRLANTLCEWAFSQRHHNAEGHSKVVAAAEKVWTEIANQRNAGTPTRHHKVFEMNKPVERRCVDCGKLRPIRPGKPKCLACSGKDRPK